MSSSNLTSVSAYASAADRDVDASTHLLPMSDQESQASSRDVKFSGKGQRHWTRKVDWGLNGYFLFCIAAWLYFLQSLSPFSPGMFTHAEEAWMGFTAAMLFLIESIMYVFGWYIDRQIHIERGEMLARLGETWNFWGNVLFVMGSIGYVVTSAMVLLNCCEEANMELNLYLAVLFIFDSVIYTFGVYAGESSRVARPEGTIAWFRSGFDYYSLATALFFLGSVLYFVSALMTKLHRDPKWVNLFAGVIFVVDGGLYVVSTLQHRDDSTKASAAVGVVMGTIPVRSAYFYFNR